MIALLLGLLLGPADLGEAERAYRAGRYEEARTVFEAALSEPDAPRGALLYDMGNCSYRLGRHAEAVLCYRRALLRLPGDEQVEANLRLAERRLGIDTPDDASPGAAVLAWIDAIPPRALLIAVGVMQGVGLVGFVLLRRRRAARAALALLVVIALLGAARLARVHWLSGPPAGVVLHDEIELRAEPRDDSPVSLELGGGELVRLGEASDGWIRVAHPHGAGWTASGGVGVID